MDKTTRVGRAAFAKLFAARLAISVQEGGRLYDFIGEEIVRALQSGNSVSIFDVTHLMIKKRIGRDANYLRSHTSLSSIKKLGLSKELRRRNAESNGIDAE